MTADSMRVHGTTINDMGKGLNGLLTIAVIQGSTVMTLWMGKACFGGQMGRPTMVNTRRVTNTEKGSGVELRMTLTQASGLTISLMVKERTATQMVRNTRGNS